MELVLASGVLTFKDGVVHIGRCEHKVAKFYGSFGTRVLEGVISAVEGLLSSTSYRFISIYICKYFEVTVKRWNGPTRIGNSRTSVLSSLSCLKWQW